MTFCNDVGLGLAMFHTSETFADLKKITGSGSGMFDKPAWTALNNAKKEKCDKSKKCDGKLVM